MPIKTIIKKARNQKNIFQTDLGKLVGCSQQTIVDIESGQITKSSYLPEICDVLDIDYGKMMANPDAPLESLRLFRFQNFPVIPSEMVYGFLYEGSTLEDISGETRLEHLPSPVNVSDRAFWLQVTSDLMEPSLKPGDFALIDPSFQFGSGALIALFMNGSRLPCFRKIFMDGEREDFLTEKTNERVVHNYDSWESFKKIGAIITSTRIL